MSPPDGMRARPACRRAQESAARPQKSLSRQKKTWTLPHIIWGYDSCAAHGSAYPRTKRSSAWIRTSVPTTWCASPPPPELAQAFIDEQVAAVREQIGDKKVLLALSGGVDSSVVAALLIKAIGKQLICVHVNHGLMRKGESEQVIDVFKNQLDANLVYVDATDRFLGKFVDVEEPEAKRKIIGAEFIRVFEEEACKVGNEVSFLAQGTIYPDILESQDGVKAHHNVGGLPDDLQFELCEPVKLLFKDEVPIMNFWFTTCKPCVGEPIMGGINSAEQREVLNKLIEQALAWVRNMAKRQSLCRIERL